MRHIARHTLYRLKGSALVKLSLKIGLTVSALWFVFREVDFDRLGHILEKQDTSPLLLAFMLLNIQLFLGSIRWRMILGTLAQRGQHILSVGYALTIYYIGMFFNMCLPGGTIGGDAVRVWLTKSDHVPLSLSIHSVIIDRIIALMALGLMVVIGAPFLGRLAGFDGAAVMLLLLAVGVAGLWAILRADRLFRPFQETHAVRQVIYFLSSFKLLLSHPFIAILSISYAMIGHIIFCIALMIIAGSMGIQLSLFNSLILIPPVILAATLPISIGGWGIREAGMVVMLGLIGIPQEEALMLSIENGLIAIAVSLPGGICWLLHKRHKGHLDVDAMEKEGITDKV